MPPSSRLIVEFFGIPRQRAGVGEITLEATSALEALLAVQQSCPRLGDLLNQDRLAPHYLLSIDGTRFVTDLAEPLPTGTRLLLLSADAGG